jgi:hypothetical protein
MKLAFLRLKYSEEDNKKADFELGSYLKGGFTYHQARYFSIPVAMYRR